MPKCVYKEYTRLKKLFTNVDDSKRELVDELLRKASFLKVELDNLEKLIISHGSIEKSSKGNVRQSVYYRTYLSSLNVYQGIIKTLNSIMGKNIIDDDDEFDEFLRKANELSG